MTSLSAKQFVGIQKCTYIWQTLCDAAFLMMGGMGNVFLIALKLFSKGFPANTSTHIVQNQCCKHFHGPWSNYGFILPVTVVISTVRKQQGPTCRREESVGDRMEVETPGPMCIFRGIPYRRLSHSRTCIKQNDPYPPFA